MANKIDDRQAARAEVWAKYREYLDGLEDHLTADAELKPGSRAWVKLRELSDRLAAVQDKDFTARQLKAEIDRALSSASGGGLLQAFASMRRKSDEDSFD
ncbi:MAG: hypothetical protein IPJ65_13435 [Archangiaceae bacterium]|nr:hypothetical protein [Archangiaceae bacterium]